jgi:hypothetical protein
MRALTAATQPPPTTSTELRGERLATFLLAHEVLAFVTGRRQRLHGLPGALAARLEGAALGVVLRLAACDTFGARVAARTALRALQSVVALGALTDAEAGAPRAHLTRLERSLAAPGRAA